MATREDLRRRIQAIAAQLNEEMGEISVPDEECWLGVVEDLAAELGDAMATALVEGQSQNKVSEAVCECPQCGKPGRYRGARERELITRRGPATIQEPEYFCTCCRKSFFPDDASAGH